MCFVCLSLCDLGKRDNRLVFRGVRLWRGEEVVGKQGGGKGRWGVRGKGDRYLGEVGIREGEG